MEERRAQVVEFRQPERVRCVQELPVRRELQRLGRQRGGAATQVVGGQSRVDVRSGGRPGCTQADAGRVIPGVPPASTTLYSFTCTALHPSWHASRPASERSKLMVADLRLAPVSRNTRPACC